MSAALAGDILYLGLSDNSVFRLFLGTGAEYDFISLATHDQLTREIFRTRLLV